MSINWYTESDIQKNKNKEQRKMDNEYKVIEIFDKNEKDIEQVITEAFIGYLEIVAEAQ